MNEGDVVRILTDVWAQAVEAVLSGLDEDRDAYLRHRKRVIETAAGQILAPCGQS